jgi:hypothetical protein
LPSWLIYLLVFLFLVAVGYLCMRCAYSWGYNDGYSDGVDDEQHLNRVVREAREGINLL